jgi:hypothetical protein
MRHTFAWSTVLGTLAVALTIGSTAAAQTASRIATTVEALVAQPVFFHGKQIAVRRGTVEAAGVTLLANTPKPIVVLWREHGTGALDTEIRGEFWDLGRLQQNDPRFSTIDFQPILNAVSHGEWPQRDSVFVILNATTAESPLPIDATIRAIALAPDHYDGHTVTVVGRFRGANLFGDLPQPVAKGRWDFVLQSADGAIWITGLRPRGKGFDLDPGRRLDTGRWLSVSGTVHGAGAPLPWIEASAIQPAAEPNETTVEMPAAPPPPSQPPPAVIFSAPPAGDSDVDPAEPVRIQFSRDMDPKSFKDHIRIAYVSAQAGQAPPFTWRYDEGTRGLEIKFNEPLPRLTQVRIQLLTGITSNIDGQPLAPFALTFTTGR